MIAEIKSHLVQPGGIGGRGDWGTGYWGEDK